MPSSATQLSSASQALSLVGLVNEAELNQLNVVLYLILEKVSPLWPWTVQAGFPALRIFSLTDFHIGRYVVLLCRERSESVLEKN